MGRYDEDMNDKDTDLTGRGWIFGLLLGGLLWSLIFLCWIFLI